MININLKEVIKAFDSKKVKVARVNTQDGRSFCLSVSVNISEDSTVNVSEDSTIQNGKRGVPSHSFNILRSPVECDTSGCMNSSPDSERSGILNPPELVDNVACNVDDFLTSFNDPTFRLESQSTVGNLTHGITDEAECESIADSDCDTIGIEYFVVDELVGKRFNDKTQKYEFLLRPKRYIPKNEIMWNPIDNLDNFDISLLEHNRLYIEVPDSLKRQEKRKRSVLQDKFLSEVNLPSGNKTDDVPSSSGDLRNSNFEKMYPSYMCSGSADNTMDVEIGNISANFEDLVPVVPVLLDSGHQNQTVDSGHQNQTVDSSAFPASELKQKKPGRPRQRVERKVHVYSCHDCGFNAALKRTLAQHIRTHLKAENSRSKQRKKTQDTHDSKQPKRLCRSKTKLAEKSSNSEKHSPPKSKSAKRKRSDSAGNANTLAKKKNFKQIENTLNGENIMNGTCPDVAMGEIIEQESKSAENCNTLPLHELNLHDENSREIFYSPEIKSKRSRGCVRSRSKRVQEEGNAFVENEKVIKVEPFDGDQPVNGALNTRQTRKRSCTKIKIEETENTLNDRESNKILKFADDGPLQSGMAVPNEHPEEVSNSGGNDENRDSGLQLPEQISISLPEETKSKVDGKPSTCSSFPVAIPLSALENAGIDVEMLRRKLRKEGEEENSIAEEKLPPVSATGENAPSSAEVDCTSVDVISPPSQVKVPTEVFNSESTAADEEVILSTMNRMLDIIESESDNTSKGAINEDNSTESNQRLQNSAIEKESIESDETFRDASVETNVAIESQEPKLPSVFNKVVNSIEKEKSSPNPPSEDVRFRRCLFCDFVSVGYAKYREHIIDSHADKFKRCNFCSKSLMSEASMKRHERENHAEYLPFVLLPRIV